ncbi:Retrovirus-related Pol polyprotein from transposon 17.6, partial [Mucuna pruriens]
MRLLAVGIIYPISDNQWVNLVQVVQKRFGVTIMKNRHDEMKLNQETRKDHFPMRFIDQVHANLNYAGGSIMGLSVYAESFEACLENLSRVLRRCMETNLILYVEKCHFMVTEGIVLGHLMSSRGIEVDKAKVDIITSLPNPAFLQEVRLFLGHAGFYRCFIKNFSKIALPLSKLLQKDVEFIFDQPCVEAF